MDTAAIKWKLKYVKELLEDVRHFQQFSAHTCPCDICSRKQNLVQISIAKAVEEIDWVSQKLDSSYDKRVDFAHKHNKKIAMANLNCSCGSDVTSTGSDEISKFKQDILNNTSSDCDVNGCHVENVCQTKMVPKNVTELARTEDKILTSVQGTSLKDSGVHNSSEIISPISCGSDTHSKSASSSCHQHLSRCSSQRAQTAETSRAHPSSDLVRSTCCLHKSTSHQPRLSMDKMCSTPEPFSSHPHNTALNLQDKDTVNHHVTSRQHLGVDHFLQSKPSSCWQYDQSETAAPDVTNMFMSFPLLPMPPTGNLTEVEKYRRYSEEISRKPGFYDGENPRHQSFSNLPSFSSLTSVPVSCSSFSLVSGRSSCPATDLDKNSSVADDRSNTDSKQVMSEKEKCQPSVCRQNIQVVTSEQEGYQPASIGDIGPSLLRSENSQTIPADDGDTQPTIDDKPDTRNGSSLSPTSFVANQEIAHISTRLVQPPSTCESNRHCQRSPILNINKTQSVSAVKGEESFVDKIFLEDLRQRLMELHIKDRDSSSKQMSQAGASTSCGESVDIKHANSCGDRQGKHSTISDRCNPGVFRSDPSVQCDRGPTENDHHSDGGAEALVRRDDPVTAMTDSMWRPWEAKDNILALMSSPSDYEDETEIDEKQMIVVKGQVSGGPSSNVAHQTFTENQKKSLICQGSVKGLGKTSTGCDFIEREAKVVDVRTDESGNSGLIINKLQATNSGPVKTPYSRQKDSHCEDGNEGVVMHTKNTGQTDSQEKGRCTVKVTPEQQNRQDKQVDAVRSVVRTPGWEKQDQHVYEDGKLNVSHSSSADRFVNKRKRMSPKMGVSSPSVSDVLGRNDRNVTESLEKSSKTETLSQFREESCGSSQLIPTQCSAKVEKIIQPISKIEESVPVFEETSLKCVSNIEHSPRKGRSSELSGKLSLMGSSKSSFDVKEDKENENLEVKEIMQKLKFSSLKNVSASEKEKSNKGGQGNAQTIHVESNDVGNRAKSGAQEQVSYNDKQTPTHQLVSDSNSGQSCTPAQADSETELSPPLSSVPSMVISSPGRCQTGLSMQEEHLESRAATETAKSQLPQWGAPAVMADVYLSNQTHLKSDKVVCQNNTQTTQSAGHPGGQDSLKMNSIGKAAEFNKRKQFMEVPRTGKTNLNLSLPLPDSSNTRGKKSTFLKPVNESFEANQSFPKMAKSSQSAAGSEEEQNKCYTKTVGEQDVITELHQIVSTTPSHPAPRSRRSIFGLSPPDEHLGEKVKARRISQAEKLSGQTSQSEDPSDSGYMENLWSALDASADIGQVPTVQEVLFNCVTSSICVVDPQRNGKIISVNESFQCLIGLHEKVIGQRLFRFVKIRDPLDGLGSTLPQSFVLADGQHKTVMGKMLYCVDDRGDEVPVSVWAVPYSRRPQLTLCVIGVTGTVTGDVYLSQQGKVLMYSEQLEGILGLPGEDNRDSVEGACQLLGLDFAKVETCQHTVVQTKNGSNIPVTVILTSSPESDDNIADDDINDGTIIPANLTLTTNMVGLISVQSDGRIKSWDQNFFRVHLGHHNLKKKNVSELLSCIVRMSQSSARSSHNSSPTDKKESSPGASMTLDDISRLQEGQQRTPVNMEKENDNCRLHLSQACFAMPSAVKIEGSDDSYEADSQDSIESEEVEEEEEKQTSFTLHVGQQCPVPHQTSTPCKAACLEHPRVATPVHNAIRNQEQTLLENGIFQALFLHGLGQHLPVTFKLSRIQTQNQGWLFCLWIYIQANACQPENEEDEPGEGDLVDSLEESEEDDEEVEEEQAETTMGDPDVKKRLKQLRFDHSLDRTVEPSLGQLIMEQAGLNQSHNATSEADMLDLEAAIDGSFSKLYVVAEALGQGSFGFVRRAHLLDSIDTVVVKFIKKSKMFDDSWIVDEHNRGRQLPLEVAILRDIDCPYIIQLVDVHENSRFVQMVMEDFGLFDLFDMIDQIIIDEPLACFIFRQILWAVEYLHKQGIIHRDIKDENVIVNQEFHCKLIDFGSAAYVLPKGEVFTKFRGTMEYCSPEVYQGKGYRGPELDMWALGVTLYTIVFRENPFAADEMPCQLTGSDLPSPVSSDLTSLLLGLLIVDPTRRWTMKQAVSSEWLRQIVDMNQYDWQEMFGVGPEVSDLQDNVDG